MFTALIISIPTAAVVKDSGFRMFMLILAFGIGIDLFLLKLYANGIDNGTIPALYSKDNLNKRGIFFKLGAIIVFYFVFFLIGIYCIENDIAVKGMTIFMAVAVLLFITEVFLFFKTAKGN